MDEEGDQFEEEQRADIGENETAGFGATYDAENDHERCTVRFNSSDTAFVCC